jgi:hypothetical protein
MIEAVRRIGLGDRAVVADNRHILIIVVECGVAEIVAAGNDDAIIRKWIDDDDFVVNDRDQPDSILLPTGQKRHPS